MRNITVIILISLMSLMSTSCTNAFKESIKQEIEEDVTFVMAQANVESNVGATFGWGAIIANTVHMNSGTYIEVLHTPLNNLHRIINKKISYGRYIIFSPRQLPVKEYYRGRILSVAGILLKEVPGIVDDATYSYPVIEAISIRLWGKAKSVPMPIYNFGSNKLI